MLVFAVATLPFVAFIAVLNGRWYGSPLKSGYGTLSALYSLDRIGPNVRLYAAWFLKAQTPLAFAWLAAPYMVRTTAAERYRVVLVAIVYPLVMLAIYAPYLTFHEWSYLRFLLPALPVALIAMAAFIDWAARPLPGALRAVALVTLGTWLIGHGVRAAVEAGVPQLRAAEQRYVAVGRFAERATPANAIYISLQHSGSLRYYTGRPSIRFDYINVDLHRAIADLERAGWKPYIVLEDWEETQFKEQFASASEEGRLAWRPLARFRARGINIYDPEQMHNPPRESMDIPAPTAIDCRAAPD
jgi:hypothetical protein